MDNDHNHSCLNSFCCFYNYVSIKAVASVARRTAEAKEVKEENFELRTTVAKLKREIDESTTVGSGGECSLRM